MKVEELLDRCDAGELSEVLEGVDREKLLRAILMMDRVGGKVENFLMEFYEYDLLDEDEVTNALTELKESFEYRNELINNR